MRKIALFIISTFLVNYSILAQDSRRVAVAPAKKNATFLTSLKQSDALLEVYRNHSYTIYYDNLIVEYEERMKANVQKYKVIARKMKKPQYSDPSYFGHKRKPKKRAVGKRKYCRECEIVH